MLEFQKKLEIKQFEQVKKDIRILALDDDSVIINILTEIFKNVYTFKGVSTVKDFSQVIKEYLPDILMIDVMLPDGNGIELCKELRSQKQFGHLHIIMLTSFDDLESIKSAYTAGANDYIRKPFIPFEIYSKLSQVAKSIKAEHQILELYKYQKDFNRKLYNFAQLINKNLNIKDKQELIKSLFQASEFLKCKYAEVVFSNEETGDSSTKNIADEKFKYIPYKELVKKVDKAKCEEHMINYVEIENDKGETVFCSISEVYFNKKKEGCLLLEKDTSFAKGSNEMLSLYLDFVNILGVDIFARDMMKVQLQKGRYDLAKVRTIQVSLLPHFEDVERFDISSSFIPMEEVSGDFFDGLYTNDDIYQIMLCDVSGHGIASSYVGGSIRSILRTAAKEDKSAGDTMAFLNNEIVSNLANIYYFSTIVLCRLNVKTGETTLVSGGHPPCFFYDAEKNTYEMIKSTGPLVGLIEGADYGEQVLHMKVGDCLFLYTDGVTEAPSPEGEMFGEESLYELFSENIEKPSMDIVHTILGTIYEHTGYSSLQDDITMICIKRIAE